MRSMVEICDQEKVVIDWTSRLCLINLFRFGIESIKLKDIKRISVPNHHPYSKIYVSIF